MIEKDFTYMENLLFVNYKFVLYFQLGELNRKGIKIMMKIHI